MSSQGGFQDLEIWKKCKAIRKDVFELCKTLPKSEMYRLADQMIRSSRSAGACIAEGYGRYHYQENIQFCRQARGSLYELIDHFMVCEECMYSEPKQTEFLLKEVELTIKLLNGYINYLKRRKEAER